MSSILHQVIIPVEDLNRAQEFYTALLEVEGRRVSPRRLHLACGPILLTCESPAEGATFAPNANPVCFAVPDLEALHERARQLGCASLDDSILSRPWGGSFHARDPFGNPIGFVDQAMVECQREERAQGGPLDHLHIDLPLSIQADQEGAKKIVGSVEKIFSAEAWMNLGRVPADLPFSEGDRIQIQYWAGDLPYVATAELRHVSGSFLAFSLPDETRVMQRRTSPRILSEIPIAFVITEAATASMVSDQSYPARTVDISVGGLRFETDIDLEKGDEVRLTIQLTGGTSLRVRGKIVAKSSVEREGQDLNAYGVQFMELKLDDQIKILQFLIDLQEASEEEGAPTSEAAPAEPGLSEEPPSSPLPTPEPAPEPEPSAVTGPASEPPEASPDAPPTFPGGGHGVSRTLPDLGGSPEESSPGIPTVPDISEEN